MDLLDRAPARTIDNLGEIVKQIRDCQEIGLAVVVCQKAHYEAYWRGDVLVLNWTFDDPSGLFGIMMEFEAVELVKWIRGIGHPLTALVWRELETADLSDIPAHRMRSLQEARKKWDAIRTQQIEDPKKADKGYKKAAIVLPG